MTTAAFSEGIYNGTVVHKRVRPKRHALSYRVFSCLFDVDRLSDLDRRLRLFSYNRFNLVSLNDRDHSGSEPLGAYLRRVAEESGHGDGVTRFLMLCYPRVLGYVFNPLTVYYGLDGEGRVALMVYEVSNTFGERMTYVLPTEPEAEGVIFQECEKRFYVSPFNAVEGRYQFHVTPPAETVTVGVALRTGEGPLLSAHFSGDFAPFTDGRLLKALARTGWLTAKVIAGIHYEALRLWLKGLRLKPRPAAPNPPITFVRHPREEGQER
ncbi:DUF1365 domain-containing protein [Rhodobium gokarnense]|uniref:DUF1365 family protein n=1 Tax=Rhodobium gokarnense TaxID=364296 RepID=A0ABT3HES1_9HYPH|nr:DUF1365 domain-containing protein [Rhodobium gokarnense]MCW2308893.1 DUF1365 family protein [Rhodobium gokarnense]